MVLGYYFDCIECKIIYICIYVYLIVWYILWIWLNVGYVVMYGIYVYK